MTAPFIIMGAHGGIGEALAHILLEQNKPMLLTARDTNTLQHFSTHANVQTAAVDVLQPDSITAALAPFTPETGGIAGLAYCIGSIDLKPLKGAADDAFLKSFELNVLGAVRALRAAEKALKAAQGSVVLFSTIAVQQGFTNHSLISTAKGAVEGLTRALAAEWAPDVRVNCIAPSLTDTPLAKALSSSEAMAKSIAALHPIPRLGTAQDSAALAAFLLSPDSGWITGQVLHVDGGRSSLRVKG
jgi:NAD(P)-dependent dehydrogenase (short-subunit alcohol dehydrogenase family)